MKKTLVIASLLALMLFGCIKVDNYVSVEENSVGAPLEYSKKISIDNIAKINNYLSSIECDACTIIQDNKILVNYGDFNLPMNCASVRKSIFSALYGIAQEKGLINLDATLQDLKIDDDKQPLTEIEKKATIRMLLQARSGIYLPALGESQSNRDLKPKRGSHYPGTYFYYNNWDFNILPIILERVTGKKIGNLIFEWLAKPVGMTHFKPEDVTYEYGDYTEYPQTRVYITSEDLARLGLLYTQNGLWIGVRVIPENWVKESVLRVSKETSEEPGAFDKWKTLWTGYAYLWWTDDINHTIWAAGTGGQFLIIDKANNFTVSIRKNTGISLLGNAVYNFTQKEITKPEADSLYNMVRTIIKIGA